MQIVACPSEYVMPVELCSYICTSAWVLKSMLVVFLFKHLVRFPNQMVVYAHHFLIGHVKFSLIFYI